MNCQFCNKDIDSSESLEKMMNNVLKALGSKLLFTESDIKSIHDNLIKNNICYNCNENLKNMYEKNKKVKIPIGFLRMEIKKLEINTDTKSKIKYHVLKIILNEKMEKEE